MFKAYYWLTKPGIVYGNALPAVAGFLLASQSHIKLSLLIETIVGLSLVVASACVFNNIMDRQIDSVMARTHKRPLVTGVIKPQSARIYGLILSTLGFGLLIVYTNWLAVIVTSIGFIDYVWLYGAAKRGTVHSTVIGSISGAVPPVVGYVAVSNRLDAAAWLLFIIMVLWQMPHFYAIAIYRYNDYKAAGLPVLPVKKDFAATHKQIIIYIIAFAVAALGLNFYGFTGLSYLFVMLLLAVAWLYKAVDLKSDKDAWARDLFKFSLIVLLGWSILIALNNWLP